MALFRRRKAEPVAEQPAEVVRPAVEGVRRRGPWDSSEQQVDRDDPVTVDLGSLIVRGRVGYNLQLPTDGENGPIGSVVMTGEGSGLELRAFAAPKSGGLWAEVMADILVEVEKTGGATKTVDGPFGPELHVRVPVKMPDGSDGFQPSRIMGIDGPRWMLRATFLGQAALTPENESPLMDALRDVVVVRGEGPRLAREPLLLTVPEQTVVPGAD